MRGYVLMKGARTTTTHHIESDPRGEIVDVTGLSGEYGKEGVEDAANLSRRRTIIIWAALGIGIINLCLITPVQGFIFSLQFSVCLALLTLVGFRWWTRPVHPGVFGYFSPHTIILLNGLFFFGIGNLAPLIIPEQVVINYGATDFYLPMLAIIVAGLAVFDGVYRLVVNWLSLNGYIERGLRNFFTPGVQNAIPLYTVLAYLLCGTLFIYMTGAYMFQQFSFAGAVSEVDNIYARSSFLMMSLTFCLMGILFFSRKNAALRALVIVGFLSFFPILFAYQSRKLLICTLLVLMVIYMLYYQKRLKVRWIVLGGILLLLGFLIMSIVKMTRLRDPSIGRFLTEERNIFTRADKIIKSEEFTNLDNLQSILLLNAKKRIAALDFPSAIMDAHISNGIPFMYGEHNLLGAAKIIPRVIWPGKPQGDAEDLIVRHYELSHRDQHTTLFASAYADWGIAGILGGGAFLAIFFGAVLRVILIRKDGILVYLLALYVLLSKFQSPLLMSSLYWLRWVVIIMVFNTIVYYIYKLFMTHRTTT